MEKIISDTVNNPMVQKAGKAGMVVVGGILLLKGLKHLGSFVLDKTESFREEISDEYKRAKKEARDKRLEKNK